MSRPFWFDTIYATLFIFFLIFIFSTVQVFNIFNVFDPISEALGDLDMSDYAFSEIRDEPTADTNIVIVNIGNLARRDVARQIQILNKYKPRAIGIDAFFPEPKEDDPIGDVLLANALKEVDQLVLVSRLEGHNEEDDTYEKVFTSHEMFTDNAIMAIANLKTGAEFQDDLKAVREFPTHRVVNGVERSAFGIEMARLINPEAAERFVKRDNEYERINFRGNVVDPFNKAKYKNQFFALDVEDVFSENFTADIIKDKLVILGFMGNYFGDPSWDDKFFTPLNDKIAGRANPDMFGVVVHANIASMVIEDNPINSMSYPLSIAFAIFVCYINVWIFSWVYRRLPRWYDGLTKLFQLIELLALTFLSVIVFSYLSYKMETTLAIVCVVLASDSLEIYNGVIKNLFAGQDRKELFRLQYDRD